MAEVVIPQANWERIQIKIRRKYRELSDKDLSYTQGQENELILRLMNRLHQDRDYVVFMLRKMQVNLDTNRL